MQNRFFREVWCVAATATAWGLCMLMGVFVICSAQNFSFEIAKWEEGSRAVFLLSAMVIPFVSIAIAKFRLRYPGRIRRHR